MTHDRPYLDTALETELGLMLRYVVERREEAEENLGHTVRRFRQWQERYPEPRLPESLHRLADLDQISGYEQMQEFLGDVDMVSVVNEIIQYATNQGMYHGMWASHQGDADHYGGQADVLRCMESELMWHLNQALTDDTRD